jgi:hypothetical protein
LDGEVAAGGGGFAAPITFAFVINFGPSNNPPAGVLENPLEWLGRLKTLLFVASLLDAKIGLFPNGGPRLLEFEPEFGVLNRGGLGAGV